MNEPASLPRSNVPAARSRELGIQELADRLFTRYLNKTPRWCIPRTCFTVSAARIPTEMS